MSCITDLDTFDTQITEPLEANNPSALSQAAKELIKYDLVALTWKNHTPRTKKLIIKKT